MSVNRSRMAIAIAAIVAVGMPTMAQAGSCTNSNRSWGTSSARPSAATKVWNKTTDKTINVEIYLGETLKQKKRIAPGGKLSYRATMSKSGGDAPVRVKFYSGNVTTDCAYRAYNKNGSYMGWEVGGGYDSVCPSQALRGVTISCDKGYNIDKRRFNTTFELQDR